MNYQIRTVLNVPGFPSAGAWGIPRASDIYGVPSTGIQVYAGDVIVACQNLTNPADYSVVFHRNIVQDQQITQVNTNDFSANMYLLVIGTPVL
jgi:hypothetical protein